MGIMSRLQGWALTALAVLAVLLGAYALGGRAARRATKQKYDYEQARRENAAAQGAHDAQIQVGAMRKGGAADELRRDWMRDDEGGSNP